MSNQRTSFWGFFFFLSFALSLSLSLGFFFVLYTEVIVYLYFFVSIQRVPVIWFYFLASEKKNLYNFNVRSSYIIRSCRQQKSLSLHWWQMVQFQSLRTHLSYKREFSSFSLSLCLFSTLPSNLVYFHFCVCIYSGACLVGKGTYWCEGGGGKEPEKEKEIWYGPDGLSSASCFSS